MTENIPFFEVFKPMFGHILCNYMACHISNHESAYQEKTDGWMTCSFTPFLTVFQIYWDNFRGWYWWNPVMDWKDEKIFAPAGLKPRTARSAGQCDLRCPNFKVK